LIEHKLSTPERIKGLKCDRCSHCTDKALPHCLIRKIVGKLLAIDQYNSSTVPKRLTNLKTEKYTSNGRAECDRYSGGGSGGQYFAFSSCSTLG
jgi:hypothetical protein